MKRAESQSKEPAWQEGPKQTRQALHLGGEAPARAQGHERQPDPVAPMGVSNPSGLMPEFTRKQFTTAPVSATNVAGMEPEFVRISDLRPLAGLKRGLANRKIKDGTFKSITLREPGKKFGVRLVYWPSVKAWLHSLLAQQNPDNA